MPLMIPWKVSATHYSAVVIIQDDSIERIKAYDPLEIAVEKLPRQFVGLALKEVFVTYSTEEEAQKVIELCQQGLVGDALRLVCRGFLFRPDLGDHDEDYVSLRRIIDLQ